MFFTYDPFDLHEKKLDDHFSKWEKEMEDPDPLRLINPTPYIRVLEYGGVRIYRRSTKNRKIGVFRFPKGGVTTRSEMVTTVFQPPHSMTRRAKPVISLFMRSAIKLRRAPKIKEDLLFIRNIMGKNALATVKRFTRVDENIAREAWRFG